MKLPPWFCLSKYNQFSVQNQQLLLEQLTERVFFLKWLSAGNLIPPPDESDSCESFAANSKKFSKTYLEGVFLRHLWAEITSTGRCHSYFFSSNENQYLPSLNNTPPLGSKALRQSLFIAPLSMYDCCRLEELIPKDDDSSFYSSDEFIRQDIPLSGWEVNPIDTLTSDRKIRLQIDLDTSDDQILSELKALLPHYRAQLGVNESAQLFRKADPKKIIEHQALPFLDLEIWSHLEGKKINDRTLNETLFKNDDKSEDRIRQTLRPFIKRISSNLFLNEWATYIDKDITRRDKYTSNT